LFNKLNQISNWKKEYKGWNVLQKEVKKEGEQPPVEQYLVQQYVAAPYLIGGKKFDLRIYALVTSYYPLKVYLHRSGFARFSNHRYTTNISDMSNNCKFLFCYSPFTDVHLTNVAIQKTSENYNPSGCKWNIRNLKLLMISKHGAEAVQELFFEIQQVILYTLLAVQRVVIQDKHCYELYGFDILIDQSLKPWLLEVNGAPSLSADTEADHELKYGVIDDTLSVMDFEHKLKGTEQHVGGFDLIYDQANNFKPTVSYLGCYVKKPHITVPRTLGKPAPPPKPEPTTT
jgi:tubulin polyglutamylase TTLL9